MCHVIDSRPRQLTNGSVHSERIAGDATVGLKQDVSFLLQTLVTMMMAEGAGSKKCQIRKE